jgi:hypothetical protein
MKSSCNSVLGGNCIEFN